MTNDTTTTRTGFRSVLWPNKWYLKVLAILVWISIIGSLLLATAGESQAAITYNLPGTPLTNPALVPVATDAQIGATLSHPLSFAMADALVQNSTLVEETSPPSLFTSPTCRARATRTSKLYVRFVHYVMAWRRTAAERWCWNSKRVITSHGGSGDDGKDSMLIWCWFNPTFSNVIWNASGTQWRVHNQGTLKVCTRTSLQRTVNPTLYYAGGGGVHA